MICSLMNASGPGRGNVTGLHKAIIAKKYGKRWCIGTVTVRLLM